MLDHLRRLLGQRVMPARIGRQTSFKAWPSTNRFIFDPNQPYQSKPAAALRGCYRVISREVSYTSTSSRSPRPCCPLADDFTGTSTGPSVAFAAQARRDCGVQRAAGTQPRRCL